MSRLKDKIKIDLCGFHGYGLCDAELSYFYSNVQNVCGYVCKAPNFIVHIESGKSMSEAVDKMHQWCIENQINGGATYKLDDIKKFKSIKVEEDYPDGDDCKMMSVVDLVEYAEEYRRIKKRLSKIEKMFDEETTTYGVLSNMIGKYVKVWYTVLGQKYSVKGILSNVINGHIFVCLDKKDGQTCTAECLYPIDMKDIVKIYETFNSNTK